MIVTRCWHFISFIQTLDRSPPVTSYKNRLDKRCSHSEFRPGRNPWSDNDEMVPDEWLNEAESCVEEINRGFSAFSALWSKFLHSQYAKAILLRFQAKSAQLSVKGSVYRRETEWIVHLNELITLAAIYLASKPKQLYIAFHNETITFSYQAFQKCRDGVIRKNILQLMADYPRREGVWGYEYAAAIGRWIMVIEDRGIRVARCNRIQEEQRVRVSRLDYDSVGGVLRTRGSVIVNGISKPPPCIDEELLESFTEREIQAVKHSEYTMKCEQQHLSYRQNILATMPSEFMALRQAARPFT
jgi:hypothetical protein